MMLKNSIDKYKFLNKSAQRHGIVIFGGKDDENMPLDELKQTFALDSNLFNRSVAELSVNNAIEIYDACVAELDPEAIILHIGIVDLDFFEQNTSAFEQKYRELISHIRQKNKKCRIAVVSLKNNENIDRVHRFNKHLQLLAEAERCHFCDITVKRVWNPRQMKETASFLYSMGFVRPLTCKRPLPDLTKILFCYC